MQLRVRRASYIIARVVLVGVVAFLLFNRSASPAPSEAAEEPTLVSALPVQRGRITSAVTVTGRVSFGDEKTMPSTASGIVTSVPPVGEPVEFGEVLFRVADRAVVLVEGATPLFRDLRLVKDSERDTAGDRVGQMVGADVLQLQNYLLSYFDGSDVEAPADFASDALFGPSTDRAVKIWQANHGHPRTGTVNSAQIVFATEPVRVIQPSQVGLEFESMVLTTTRVSIIADVTPGQRSYFEPGTDVAISYEGTEAVAVVVRVEPQTDDTGQSSYQVVLIAEDSTGFVEGDTVRLEATRIEADDATWIPVGALVALVEGGFAVEVVSDAGSQLQSVELLDVVDSKAIVDGVDEGSMVVVPA